ncbi:MAG: acetyl-CoA hydrolase/transferase C-terminal domain-containing protein [Haloferacaceae archaeon]
MTPDRARERVAGGLPERAAEDVAADVPADATLVVSGFGSVGYPKAVPGALADSGRDMSVTVASGGSGGDELDVEMMAAGQVARRYPYQATEEARTAINEGEVAFHDRHIARLGDEVAFGGLVDADVALVEAIAVGEGWLVPSMSIGPTPDYVEAADELVVEVNEAPPLAVQRLHDVYRHDAPPDRGANPLSAPDERIADQFIRFDPSKLTAVVRTNQADTAYDFREPTERDRAIAENLAAFLAEEMERNPTLAEQVNMQFGVGSLGNALMGEMSTIDFGDREVTYYGELIQDGLVDMIDEGALTAASATSLAVTPEYQRKLFDDIERYAEHVVLRPGYVSNDPDLIDRFGVVAVNAALEVDVYGNVNSTHVGGSHVVNGIGGSGDFNRHSPLAITALGSTASGGDVPRVLPMVPHVDHTEHDVDVIITERGVADLRGLSPRERAREMVEVAHPDYRPDLRAYLDRAEEGGGNTPHDLETAFDWQGRS